MLTRIPNKGEIIIDSHGKRWRVTGHRHERRIIEFESVDGPRETSLCIAYFDRTRTFNKNMTLESDRKSE
jgi:hypothetical protein